MDIMQKRVPDRARLRLFVDMDGTLAEFRSVDTLETLYEKGYFAELRPQETVVAVSYTHLTLPTRTGV